MMKRKYQFEPPLKDRNIASLQAFRDWLVNDSNAVVMAQVTPDELVNDLVAAFDEIIRLRETLKNE